MGDRFCASGVLSSGDGKPLPWESMEMPGVAVTDQVTEHRLLGSSSLLDRTHAKKTECLGIRKTKPPSSQSLRFSEGDKPINQ